MAAPDKVQKPLVKQHTMPNRTLALEDGAGAADVPATEDLREKLRRSEERYRTLFESIDEGFCVLDVLFDDAGAPFDYRFREINPAFERHTGLEDAVGKTARDLIPGLEGHWVETYGRVAVTGASERFIEESAVMGRWFEVTAFRIGGAESRQVGLLFKDISDRRRAEDALRTNEERLRRAQKVVGVGTWDLDVGTGAVTWSEGVFDLVGLEMKGPAPSAEVWEGLVHPDDRERVGREVQVVLDAGGSYHNEFRIVRPDGTTRWLAARGYVLRDEEGQLSRMLGVNYDITDRKHAEEALKDLNATLEATVAERTWQVRELSRALTLAEQEERRRIAYVLHDDLQQLLVGAKMMGSFGDAERLLAILDEAIEKTRTLSHELSPPFLSSEDISELLEWLAARKQERYGLAVEVEVSDNVSIPDPDLRVLLYQLLREILFNVAKHAGTDEASVTAVQAGGRVRIVVQDEGVGFDPARLEDGGGTFGLPSVRERLELVGGKLGVESTPGEGTCITLDVPLDGAGAEPEADGA